MQPPADRAVRQIAYFVRDAVAAARAHSALFGSGPFFVMEHIELRLCRYRGVDAAFDHTSVCGQWGDQMLEFAQQNHDGPSVFRDMYTDGQEGLHHTALIVDDLNASMAAFEAAGHATALYAEVPSGVAFAMMDCRDTLGHFVELYEPTEPICALYDLVRQSAENWDGSELIRFFPSSD